jgi:hypothetical protein
VTEFSAPTDEVFLEYVYAVLPSWGMHRMVDQAAKVSGVSSIHTRRPADQENN